MHVRPFIRGVFVVIPPKPESKWKTLGAFGAKKKATA